MVDIQRTFHRFFHWRRVRFAFGEVLMIAIGIHLAFGLDRIAEHYERLDIETRTLVELRNGVERDRADIAQNIKGYEYRMEAASLIATYIENQQAPDKNFNQALRRLLDVTTFIPSNVPFETLKARGLDTITDATLRAEVAEYYEIHRAFLITVESGYNSEQARFIMPFVKTYLDVDDEPEVVAYEKMQNDGAFRRELHWVGRYSRDMIKQYAALGGRAEVLVRRINAAVTPS